jgi:hypothetical protein
MRKIVLLALALSCVSAPALAQTTQQRTPYGGYTVYGRNGPTAWYVPNSTGGYTIYDRTGPTKWFVPNSTGGFTIYNRTGPTTWFVPHSNGGYPAYGPGVPHAIGGTYSYPSRSGSYSR